MNDAIESLLAEGLKARREGRSADAKTAYGEAVVLSRQSDNNTHLFARSLTGLGQILRDEGNKPEALQRYEEAVSVCRKLDAPLLLAHTIRHVADIQRELRLHAEADANYSEALTIYRNHPERSTLDLANTLRGYALLQAALARKAEAIALWEETGHLYDQVWREPGSPYSESDLTPGIEESQRQLSLLTMR